MSGPETLITWSQTRWTLVPNDGDMPANFRRECETIQWIYFSPESQRWHIHADASFLASLTPAPQVLEIGAGTARLANQILNHSRLNPQNYHLMDAHYGNAPPWMKKKIFLLWKQKKTA